MYIFAALRHLSGETPLRSGALREGQRRGSAPWRESFFDASPPKYQFLLKKMRGARAKCAPTPEKKTWVKMGSRPRGPARLKAELAAALRSASRRPKGAKKGSRRRQALSRSAFPRESASQRPGWGRAVFAARAAPAEVLGAAAAAKPFCPRFSDLGAGGGSNIDSRLGAGPCCARDAPFSI